MKNYLFVFIGGAAGGVVRVAATRADNVLVIGGMDLTILMINIIGAFFLGMFLSATARFNSFSPRLHLGVSIGFLGSFTTFSTLCMEAAGLLESDGLFAFALYILVSCSAGLGAAELGFRAGVGTGFMKIGRPRDIFLGAGLQQNLMPVPIQEKEED